MEVSVRMATSTISWLIEVRTVPFVFSDCVTVTEKKRVLPLYELTIECRSSANEITTVCRVGCLLAWLGLWWW